MNLFLANFSLLNHISFMLILTNDFLNFVKIMKLLFEIGSQYLGVKMEWLKKYLRGYLIYVILGYEKYFMLQILIYRFQNHLHGKK